MRKLGLGIVVVCATALAAPDPRFAPRASWSFAIPATLPSPVTQPTRDQMIEDVAYLLHAIEEAWAWSSRSTIDSLRALRPRLEQIASTSPDPLAMCKALAVEMRNTGIEVGLQGPCASPVKHADVGALDAVPANRNFRWRIDKAPDHAVGILTISNFADPKDAGWSGLAAALRELSTTDLLLVDLQQARGDDPRVGFAVLAALGVEDYANAYLRPAMFRDGPIAKAARNNAVAPPPPRSRILWSSFPTGDDVKRIAREIVPGVARPLRAVASRVLVGPDCGRACQLVVRLARWQLSELHGSFADRSGDEPGVIRLPHTGVTVTFPTAAYGPYILGGPDARQLPPDYAKSLLAGLHWIGHTRAESLAWHKRALPSCSSLPIDRGLVERKTSGCLPRPLPAKMSIILNMSVDAVTAERFLKTCNVSVGTPTDAGVGASTVSASGTLEALSQVLAAPFEVRGSWGCKPKLH